MIPRLLFLLLISVEILVAQEEIPDKQQPEPPWSQPPRLENLFTDDFETDSRGNYEISGKEGAVTWEKGKLTLDDGAILQRKLAAGSWVEIELDFEFPELTEDGQTSELKVWLDLEGATDSFVWFRQKREAEKTRSAIFFIDSEGEWNSHVGQRKMVPPNLVQGKLKNGKWTIGYRHGMWSIHGPQFDEPAFAYLKNGGATVENLVVISLEAPTILRRAVTKACKKKTTNQLPDAVRSLKASDEAIRRVNHLFKSGKFNLAIEPAALAMNSRKKFLGRFHHKYAESLNLLGVAYLQIGKLDEAEPFFLESKSSLAKVVGRFHPLFSRLLNNLGSLYERKGNFAKAERLYLQNIKIIEMTSGQSNTSYAVGLNNLAGLYWKMGELENAEAFFEEARAIMERVLGKQDASYAVSLNNIAGFHMYVGDYRKSEKLFLQAKEIIKNSLGKKHPNYAVCLDNLGDLYLAKEDYAKAEPMLMRANSIIREIFGKNHPSFYRNLNKLGDLYSSTGDYSTAELFFQDAKEAISKTSGKQHPDYANSLWRLANLYQTKGAYEISEQLYLEAMSVDESLFGKKHPNVADSLTGLANLYCQKGDYPRAEPLYKEARLIRERSFGVNHPKYAKSLVHLAITYRAIGEFSQAEAILKEALEINKRNFGLKHPSVAECMNSLGLLYLQMGEYAKSAPLLEEARQIRKAAFGTGHPSYANSLNNLVGLYTQQEEFEKAEVVCRQAIAIDEKIFGKESSTLATYLNNLALIYDAKGDCSNAIKTFSESLAIMEKAQVTEHPKYAQTLVSLASSHYSQGNHLIAANYLRKSVELIRNTIERFSSIQSVKQQRQYANTYDQHFSIYISNSLKLPNSARDVWNQAVKWKGMSLVREKRNKILAQLPESKEVFQELKQVKSRLSALLLSAYGNEEWKERVNSLTQQEQELEKRLSRIVSNLGIGSESDVSSDIQLPADSCLVDYRRFMYFLPDPEKPGKLTGRPHYLGLVKNQEGIVNQVDLGPTEKIDSAIQKWRRSIEHPDGPMTGLSGAVTPPDRKAGVELRTLIWNPLKKHLGNANLVIVSPDSALGRIPLIALPSEKPNSYLIEEKKIVHVPVPGLMRLMLSHPPKILDSSAKTLVMGDIQYGKSLDEPANANLLSYRVQRILGDLSFSTLPNTKNEIVEIGKRLGIANVLSRSDATEHRFRELASEHQILHFATHGFFRSPEKFFGNTLDESPDSPGLVSEKTGFFTETPSLLSGLALANANTAKVKTVDESENDGILFSAEISMLSLENVQLAVLSACDTGLGVDAASGEGLIGIQRAFQVAGAKSVVASYWKVDDRATQLLMNKFYENLLNYSKNVDPEKLKSNHTTIRIDALRDAQLWMLNNPIVASTTNRGDPIEVDPAKIKKAESGFKPADKNQRTHPRYWAAFMLSGDWR